VFIVVVVVYFFMTQSGHFWIHPRTFSPQELHSTTYRKFPLRGDPSRKCHPHPPPDQKMDLFVWSA